MGAPAARFEVVAGKAQGMSIVLEDELLIGRHAEGPGRLADDEEISRSHARFTYDAGGFCAVEDLGSTNGTFVNGLRISVPQTLSEGDAIELGATTLVLREVPRADSEPEEPEAAPPVAQATVSPGIVAAPSAPGTLSLTLQIDFAAGEAQLSLGDESKPMRLAFDADGWRVE